MTIRSIMLAVAFLVPMSASAQTGAFCTAVYDANGSRVGQAAQALGVTTLLLSQNGRVVRLNVTATEISGGGAVFYSEAGCTGDAYMLRPQLQPLAVNEPSTSDVWYPDTLAVIAQIDTVSERDNTGVCTPMFRTDLKLPALNMTLPTFTPPFHLEPEPCFTPAEPSPEQFIHGCIKTNGTLKIVDDPADCSNRETPISWLGE